MTDRPVAEMSFEEAMSELERVVGTLESGEASLDDSIRLYERGAELRKRCADELRRAEEKVAAITLDEQGQPKGVQPLDPA